MSKVSLFWALLECEYRPFAHRVSTPRLLLPPPPTHIHGNLNIWTEKSFVHFNAGEGGGGSNSGYSPDTATSKLLNPTIYHHHLWKDIYKTDQNIGIGGRARHHVLCQQHLSLYIYRTRLQRWSFFYNDGMVMFFFQGTIVIDGFSMVLSSLDHHHWMFFYRSTIEIDGFSMVFPNSGAMVSDGFDLEKDLKMRIIVTDPILGQLCLVFRIQITLLLVNFMCK